MFCVDPDEATTPSSTSILTSLLDVLKLSKDTSVERKPENVELQSVHIREPLTNVCDVKETKKRWCEM
jgi:hypothetical protein